MKTTRTEVQISLYFTESQQYEFEYIYKAVDLYVDSLKQKSPRRFTVYKLVKREILCLSRKALL